MFYGDCIFFILDVEVVMKMVCDSVDVWNLNLYDIGIMGFFVGGYLVLIIVIYICFEFCFNF